MLATKVTLRTNDHRYYYDHTVVLVQYLTAWVVLVQYLTACTSFLMLRNFTDRPYAKLAEALVGLDPHRWFEPPGTCNFICYFLKSRFLFWFLTFFEYYSGLRCCIGSHSGAKLSSLWLWKMPFCIFYSRLLLLLFIN